MSFNPKNLQLERICEGFTKGKFIYFKLKTTKFGRALSNDHLFSSTKCSRRHCEIFFLDGKMFIKDIGSLSGTFIQDTRIKEGVEHELKEGDVIGIGMSPQKADPNSRDDLIYKVTTPEVVEIDDDSELEDEGIVTTLDEIPFEANEDNHDDQCEDGIEAEKEVRDDQSEDGIHNDTSLLAVLSDIEAQNEDVENQSPDEESRNDPETTVNHSSSLPTTSKVTQKSVAPTISVEDVKRRHEQLRNCKRTAAKLIDAPNMMKQRKRKASCFNDSLTDFVPITKKIAPTTKKS